MSKKRNDTENDYPEFKVKGLKAPVALTLLSYDGPISSVYGDSYVTVIKGPGGGKRKWWVSEKSVAGKSFFKAVRDGELQEVDLGGSRDFVLVPKEMSPNENGEVFVMVSLRWGKVHAPAGFEDGETPMESVPF